MYFENPIVSDVIGAPKNSFSVGSGNINLLSAYLGTGAVVAGFDNVRYEQKDRPFVWNYSHYDFISTGTANIFAVRELHHQRWAEIPTDIREELPVELNRFISTKTKLGKIS